ncbi:probable E3 ubiquitin-protein ligase RNF144A-A [Papaver somniferum]|uniref:probable E3 ubiquitin-protein ligase RNF144A-A n=1 Tax=Papaver somniferum TaxID=3469 RepID=UPI000E6F92C8|nr:probable E3 ubiquitin-protein ligase RNF144A-A [Papaver somniferum]
MEEPLLISSASNRCPSRFFTCNICFTELPLERKFKGCRHPYCTNCVAKYIEAQVIYRNISKITCPEFNCNVMLEASSYQSVLPKSVFEKWCRALCESAVFLNASKGGVAYGRSYCPYRNCSELVLNECVGYSSSSKITESNCPSCKKPFCFHCMVPWKENHQCNSNREIVIDIDSKDDSLFMKIVKKKRWRRCPSCKHYVERNEGCVKQFFATSVAALDLAAFDVLANQLWPGR